MTLQFWGLAGRSFSWEKQLSTISLPVTSTSITWTDPKPKQTVTKITQSHTTEKLLAQNPQLEVCRVLVWTVGLLTPSVSRRATSLVVWDEQCGNVSSFTAIKILLRIVFWLLNGIHLVVCK